LTNSRIRITETSEQKNGINWKKDIVNNFSKVWNFGKVELRKVYNAYACSVTSIFRILSS